MKARHHALKSSPARAAARPPGIERRHNGQPPRARGQNRWRASATAQNLEAEAAQQAQEHDRISVEPQPDALQAPKCARCGRESAGGGGFFLGLVAREGLVSGPRRFA